LPRPAAIKGASLTVQVSGNGGVPADAAGAVLYLGAARASASGYVSAYPTGGAASSLAMLSYSPDETVHNLYFGVLSPTGQLTLVNQGTAPVDLMVGVQGYLVSPTASEAGSAYRDVPEDRIADTRNGTGGIPATPVPAGGSITFAATGTDNVASATISAVAESVAALDAGDAGYLSVYPAGSADPYQPGVNFNAGDVQDNDLSASLVSAVGTSGEQTITNHSSGTVDVVVSVRGYYSAPAAPDAAQSVSAAVSGTSATVSWTPPGEDGGAAIISYTVTAAPDSVTATVAGTATQVTLTGLASASNDSFTVTDANAVGSGDEASYSPPNVISGTVVAPNSAATPVEGDLVTLVPIDSTAATPSVVGTATTDAGGDWTFSVPPYSQLPADAQAAATADGGYLNLSAVAVGSATASGTTYMEQAIGTYSAWVGTSTQTAAPLPGGSSDQPLMTMRPEGPDNSAQDTTAAEDGTWAAQNDPNETDSSGDFTGDGDNAYDYAPTDAYGFQEIGGNGTYNPNVAADGTDLTNAAVTPVTSSKPISCCAPKFSVCALQPDGPVLKTASHWTTIGEFHSNWNDLGSLTYTRGATSEIGTVVSFDGGDDWDLGGSLSFTNSGSSSISQTVGDGAAYESYQVVVYINYHKRKWWWYNSTTGNGCDAHLQWTASGIGNAPSGPDIKEGPSIWNKQNAQQTVWKTDGVIAMINAENVHPGWVFGEAWPYSMSLVRGRGVTYGNAADFFGVSVDATTSHQSSVEQGLVYNGGSGNPDSKRYDWYTRKNDTIHYMWGSTASLIDNPKTFYNY
jgi:hypothetical protein